MTHSCWMNKSAFLFNKRKRFIQTWFYWEHKHRTFIMRCTVVPWRDRRKTIPNWNVDFRTLTIKTGYWLIHKLIWSEISMKTEIKVIEWYGKKIYSLPGNNPSALNLSAIKCRLKLANFNYLIRMNWIIYIETDQKTSYRNDAFNWL